MPLFFTVPRFVAFLPPMQLGRIAALSYGRESISRSGARKWLAVNTQHHKQAQGLGVCRQAGGEAATPALLARTHRERAGEDVLCKSSDRG